MYRICRGFHPRRWGGTLWTETTTTSHCRSWVPSPLVQQFSSNSTDDDTSSPPPPVPPTIRLSKLLSQYATNLGVSRRAAESLIREGHVTIAGQVIQSPHYLVDPKDLGDASCRVIKVQGKGLQLDLDLKDDKPIVYAVHKLAGEMVAERDPHGRPSLIERLQRGGVGRLGKNHQFHLKPIGRLDMPTEGLILLTNDGEYAREMELPRNQIHRVYRARVHGELTPSKLERIRKGGIRSSDGVRYGPMKVSVERNSTRRGTNTWVQLTTCEGKNRMIRNLFSALGATVTRLIRIQYGDYTLQTIPPGMAIEVPYKPLKSHKAKGHATPPPPPRLTDKDLQKQNSTADVKWLRSSQ